MTKNIKTKKEQAINLFCKNPQKALAYCKRWSNLGKHKDAIIIGAECINNADFYRQLGIDPQEAIKKAIKYLGCHLDCSI